MNFEDIFDEDSYFEMIIKKLKLEPNYVVYQNNDDEIIIDEQWISPETNLVTASKLFKFDLNFIYLIREDKRMGVLKEVLDICVLIEDYEMASILRDHIQS